MRAIGTKILGNRLGGLAFPSAAWSCWKPGRLGERRIAEDAEGRCSGIGAVQGAIFGGSAASAQGRVDLMSVAPTRAAVSMAGYGMAGAKRRSWPSVLGFAVVMLLDV